MKRTLLSLICFCFLSAGISAQQYFPPRVFRQDDKLNQFIVDWYSKQLKALQEPSLWELSQNSDKEVYRFLWLRTFHHPVAVRLEIGPDGSSVLTVKVADGAGGYAPGKLIENRSMQFSSDQTKPFLDRITQLKYWDLPAEELDPKKMGFDGSQWIIEAARKGRYKLVDRWTPRDGPIHELGLYLVTKLAELKIPHNEIY